MADCGDYHTGHGLGELTIECLAIEAKGGCVCYVWEKEISKKRI